MSGGRRVTAQVLGALKDWDTTRRSSTNITLNGTSWADVDNTLDVTLDADAGDTIEVECSHVWGSEAVDGYLDVVSVVGGSPVNAWGRDGTPDGTYQGVLAWKGASGVGSTCGGSVARQLLVGDVENGQVLLRLRGRTNTASNKTLGGDTNVPLVFTARNLGQVRAATVLGGAPSSTTVTASDTAPSSPSLHELWADTSGLDALTTYQDAVLALSPVLYIPLTDSNADSPLDLTGNHTPTIGAAGMSSVSDGPLGGRAYRFTGSGRVQVPDAASLDITGPITMMCWFRPNATQGVDRVLMTKGSQVSGASYELSVGTDNRPNVIQSNWQERYGASVAVTDTGHWYHLAACYTSGNALFYVDGVETSDDPTDTGSFQNNTQPFGVGMRSVTGTWGGLLQGDIAHVAVFNVHLSASAVTDLMNMSPAWLLKMWTGSEWIAVS